jgi:hypothetical protein
VAVLAATFACIEAAVLAATFACIEAAVLAAVLDVALCRDASSRACIDMKQATGSIFLLAENLRLHPDNMWYILLCIALVGDCR